MRKLLLLLCVTAFLPQFILSQDLDSLNQDEEEESINTITLISPLNNSIVKGDTLVDFIWHKTLQSVDWYYVNIFKDTTLQGTYMLKDTALSLYFDCSGIEYNWEVMAVNDEGKEFSNKWYFKPDCDLSIHSTIHIIRFLQYPNPAEEFIEIEVENIENPLVEIYNYHGTLIPIDYTISKKNNGISFNLNTMVLPKGIYFFKISGGGMIFIGKFVEG
ncbi:MAG: hypothetical protein A2X64_02770 [Ignavibacteria bacterium GWF2_33_9]|nr:MAG: hypothetical protein A2X64_02770 [Ignavibacteria bacterium GWF2_33_9]